MFSQNRRVLTKLSMSRTPTSVPPSQIKADVASRIHRHSYKPIYHSTTKLRETLNIINVMENCLKVLMQWKIKLWKNMIIIIREHN